MARDYDSQLLESVAVRRRRLRDALLFGPERVRRSLDENLGKAFGGVALAAVLCAGCVGWSFVSERVMKDGAAAAGVAGAAGTAVEAASW
ncbi:hypothetical protein V1J52_22695 [Streptomyces sp. TRM 70351]|uniref:hypothetical protein n=1 Tax=Streptomyces sp. TRM 70351 TaxID=3116552 RepID=UPI002E7B4646|nr:hypothetical protein [Streptomyces sp. TRM 70351]MEE1930951.1 hypothetical protein [Streptomyces sp. TRM 70351]